MMHILLPCQCHLQITAWLGHRNWTKVSGYSLSLCTPGSIALSQDVGHLSNWNSSPLSYSELPHSIPITYFSGGYPGTWGVDNINGTEIWSPFSFILLHLTWPGIAVHDLTKPDLNWQKNSGRCILWLCLWLLLIFWLDFMNVVHRSHLSRTLWQRRSPCVDAYPSRSSFTNGSVSVTRHALLSRKKHTYRHRNRGWSRTNMSQYSVKRK